MITADPQRRLRLLIPVKPFARAKSRLDLPHRAQIARQMFQHTLSVALDCVGPQRITVLTSDRTARKIAARQQVETIADRSTDLNRCLESALTDLQTRFPADTTAVMVTDLPHLTRTALLNVVGECARSDVPRLVVDHHGTGTTFISVPPGTKMPMLFGVDSAQRFTEAGAVPVIHAPVAVSHDLDVLADLPPVYPSIQEDTCPALSPSSAEPAPKARALATASPDVGTTSSWGPEPPRRPRWSPPK